MLEKVKQNGSVKTYVFRKIYFFVFANISNLNSCCMTFYLNAYLRTRGHVSLQLEGKQSRKYAYEF